MAKAQQPQRTRETLEIRLPDLTGEIAE
jgi:hypothetical protein